MEHCNFFILPVVSKVLPYKFLTTQEIWNDKYLKKLI